MAYSILKRGTPLLDLFVRSLALFAALNVGLGWIRSSWNANWLWIDGAWLSRGFTDAAIVAFAAAILLGADVLQWGRRVTTLLASIVTLICLGDAFVFAYLSRMGAIGANDVLSLSFATALLVAAWLFTRPRTQTRSRPDRRARAVAFATACAGVGLAVLAHLVAFGETDYRRDADAAVVFGAAVRSDGSPSRALFDRTRTACDLYHEGLVSHIVLSGGRNPHVPISEPECMRRIAVSRGIPEAVLILDEQGVDTLATVHNVRHIASERSWSSLLMVSHDYHLARIKLESVRAGLRAYTVPAHESVIWLGKGRFVLREVLAWGYAFVRIDRT